MFSRNISISEVKYIVEVGAVIAEYPDDQPFPSFLLLGFLLEGPIHVVLAKDAQTGLCRVITVYRPDPTLWNEDFRTKKTK